MIYIVCIWISIRITKDILHIIIKSCNTDNMTTPSICSGVICQLGSYNRHKTFNNLVNGQLTWRERELAEEHIRPCLYCLDRFTAFQEMIRYLRDAQPLPDSEVGTLLAALGLSLPRKGLLGRMFS